MFCFLSRCFSESKAFKPLKAAQKILRQVPVANTDPHQAHLTNNIRERNGVPRAFLVALALIFHVSEIHAQQKDADALDERKTSPSGITLPGADSQSLMDGAPNGSVVELSGEQRYNEFIIEGSALTVQGSANRFAQIKPYGTDTAIDIRGNSNVVLKNIEITPGSSDNVAIIVENSELTLSECRISGQFEFAILLIRSKLTVNNCDIDGSLNAIAISDGSSVQASDIRITDSVQLGIALEGKDSSLDATGLAMSGGTGAGLAAIKSAGTIRISQSKINTTGSAVIIAGEIGSVEVTQSDLRSLSEERPTIWLKGDFPARLARNTLAGNVGTLLVDGSVSHETLISGNMIFSGYKYGVAVYGDPQITTPIPLTVNANSIYAPWNSAALYLENTVGASVSENFVAAESGLAYYLHSDAGPLSGSQITSKTNIFMSDGPKAIHGIGDLAMDNVLVSKEAANIDETSADRLRTEYETLAWLSASENNLREVLQLSYVRAFNLAERATRVSGTAAGSEIRGGAFMYDVVDGNLVTGPELAFRKTEELSRVLKALGPWPPADSPVRRLEAAQEDIDAALTLAWSELEASAERVSAGEQNDDTRRAWAMINWALAIIQAADTAESVQRLVDLYHIYPILGDRPVQAAAALETRTGTLANGLVYSALKEIQDSNPKFALALAYALAENGHPYGVEKLADLLEAGAPLFYAEIVYYQALVASDTEAARSFLQKTFDDFKTSAEEAWQRAKSGEAPNVSLNRSNLPFVLLAVGAVDSGQLEGLPIPYSVIDRNLFPLLSEPQELFAVFNGVSPKAEFQPRPAVYSLLDDQFCLAQLQRPPAKAKDIYLDMVSSLAKATGDSPPDYNFQFTVEATTSECRIGTEMAQQVAKQSDLDAERNIFANFPFANWIRRPRAMETMGAEFSANGLGLSTFGPSETFALEELEAFIPERDEATAAYRKLFLARTGLFSQAYVPRRSYPDQILKSVVLRRIQGQAGPGAAALMAHLDIKPRITDGRLQLGVRLRTDVGIENGLAMQISGEINELNATLEGGAREMLRDISLLAAGDEITMSHIETTGSGVHVFEAELPETGFSDLSAHIQLSLLKSEWTIDLPLYWSHFAYRRRLEEIQ